jgi:hypothetical protein
MNIANVLRGAYITSHETMLPIVGEGMLQNSLDLQMAIEIDSYTCSLQWMFDTTMSGMT